MSLTPSMRFKVLTRDAFTCQYCGRSAPTVELHVDHVHPVSRGGADDESNLVAACKECNSSKSDKLLPARCAAPTVTPLKTFAHADSCATCGDRHRLYAAFLEKASDAGYLAYYTCVVGHTWMTYWDAALRLTASELSELTHVEI